MTDKEFRRLSRSELIEIIHEYQKREAALQAEVETLSAQVADKEQRLADVGSVATAAERLDNVLLQTLQTAYQYLQSVKGICVEKEQQANALLEQAKQQAGSNESNQPAPDPNTGKSNENYAKSGNKSNHRSKRRTG